MDDVLKLLSKLLQTLRNSARRSLYQLQRLENALRQLQALRDTPSQLQYLSQGAQQPQDGQLGQQLEAVWSARNELLGAQHLRERVRLLTAAATCELTLTDREHRIWRTEVVLVPHDRHLLRCLLDQLHGDGSLERVIIFA